MKQAYSVENPDWIRSPLTGMTRDHYIQCAKYVLGRAFTHVKSFDDYIVFPTVPGKTYPQPDDPPWRYRALEFEGLRRTMALASPLMHVEPDVTLQGINLREYYGHHLHNALTPGHANSIPLPQALPDATYQFTCELGGLCAFLLLMPDILWPHYTKAEQDAIAKTLHAWGHHRTTQNNWRFFNISILSFLLKNGYAVDETLLRDHLKWIASYYAGDGWFLEQNYNYYTISMYSIYETIWCRAFGDGYWPEMADVFEGSTHRLMQTFPWLFGRDGYINMWSRSICYRLWVAGGFLPMFLLRTPPDDIDPGWARRLCSGAVLQFTAREDFYDHDVPSLGFYGHREYMLQGYSCAASPFTMFMPFLTLVLPEDSAFWTATENERPWERLGQRTQSTVLQGPGLVLVNHGSTGTSEIVPAKVNEEDHNYNRLRYNTHFPWEKFDPDGCTAMAYQFDSLDPRDVQGRDATFYLGLPDGTGKARAGCATPQAILFCGFRDGVLYRQLIMRRPPNNGSGYIIDLAEISIPGGVLRVDRCRLAYEHRLRLGHYGVAHLNERPAAVERRTVRGREAILVSGQGRQTALVLYNGFDALGHVVHDGCNAETERSTVAYAIRERHQQNPPMELMITLMLHKLDNAPWTDEELDPVADLHAMEIMPSGAVEGALLTLRDGTRYRIDFAGIDGARMC